VILQLLSSEIWECPSLAKSRKVVYRFFCILHLHDQCESKKLAVSKTFSNIFT